MYFSPHWNELVDYLHFMHVQPWCVFTAKPRAISSYDTIIYPFDIYTWGFTFGLIATQFALLLMMQNLWSNVIGKSNPQDYIYEGLSNNH